MGWQVDWVLIDGSFFSEDFGVIFLDKEVRNGWGYNYLQIMFFEEFLGVSVFLKLDDGCIGYSYFIYGCGFDILNMVYNLFDQILFGWQEYGLFYFMVWVCCWD